MSPSPLTFLCVATEWSSSHGGLSTFNRELCASLVAEDQRVFCLVPRPSAAEEAAAKAVGVTLIWPDPVPGLSDFQLLCTTITSLSNTRVDVIVGHSRITGPCAVAQLRNFNAARYVHFLHMSPKQIDWHKPRTSDCTAKDIEERMQLEVELGSRAALVVAIGPELQNTYSVWFNGLEKNVESYLPGLTPPADWSRSFPRPMHCLLFGRVDDAELKGVNLAAACLQHLERENVTDIRDLELCVLGATPQTADSMRAELIKTASSQIAISVRPYTTTSHELRQSIRGASLVLMPSKEEGFGLSGLEAISEGIPVLLSDRSGLARALEDAAPEEAHEHIVDVRRGPEHLAQRMACILRDRDTAFARVRSLRERLRSRFSWRASTQALLGWLNEPAESPPPNSPPSPIQPIDGLLQELAMASRPVSSLPQTLGPHNSWIERPELHRLVGLVPALESPAVAVALLGPPGSGKSSLLAKLTSTLTENGTAVLALKADTLPSSVESLDALRSHLNLPVGLADLIASLVQVRSLAIVIDQLDTVSELMDVKSRRLSVLLELIERALQHPNVLVVASCRSFEYQHDARFRRINFTEISLELPPRDAVLATLTASGYSKDVIASSPVDFLRTPQHLRLFLSLGGDPGDSSILDPYHRLLASLWRSRVTLAGEALERTACQLADRMANEEELWVDPESTDIPAEHVQQLVAAEIVTYSAGHSSKVGFSHQTLFSFALARSFSFRNRTLLDFVMEKNQTLFVRPHLWILLPYMRAMNPSVYQDQLERLWHAPQLRPHLKELLIRFVGTVEPLSLREIALMLQSLSDARSAATVLENISGKAVWLENATDPLLRPLMRSHPGAMIPFLVQAALHDLPRCNKLVQSEWVPDSSYKGWIAEWLWQSIRWDDATVEIAENLLRQQDLPSHAVSLVVDSASQSTPTHAPRLLVAALITRQNALDTSASQTSSDARPSFPSFTDIVLRSVKEIHSIDACATAAPKEFIASVWPWFRSLLEGSAGNNDGTTQRFSSEPSIEADPDEDGVARALADALRKAATDDIDWLASFVAQTQTSHSATVHKFIIVALLHTLPTSTALAFHYLTRDVRCLTVGSMGSDDVYSADLVEHLSEHLTEAQRLTLEELIAGSRPITPQGSAQAKRIASEFNDQHRFSLLLSLGEQRLSSKARQDLRAGLTRFPFLAKRPRQARRSVARFIGSPVSAEQMRRARDEDILGIFEELTDATGMRHPTRSEDGGSVQASQAFAELARLEPSRVSALLPHFVPKVSERPVAYALEPLAASMQISELEELIHNLVKLGFSSREFRKSVAYALESRALPDSEMSPATIALLESWLADSEPNEHVWQPSDASKGSILWGMRGFGILPGGNFPILSALTTGLLTRKAQEGHRWLGILEQHLLRRELPEVWGALCSRLRWVFFVDAVRGARIVDAIFREYPAVLQCTDGMRLIAHAMHHVDADQTWRWLCQLRDAGTPWTSQAFGELMALLATRTERPLLAWTEVNACIDEIGKGPPTNSQNIAVGIAYAAGNLWSEHSRRESATEILCRILASENIPIASAAMAMFSHDELPRLDRFTESILECIREHPSVLAAEESDSIIPFLESIVAVKPEMVASLSLSFVRGSPSPQRPFTVIQNGEALTRIALTLQRLGPTFQDSGLTLFEELLAAGAYGAVEVLHELDLQPPRQPRRRRLSRRRSRT